MNMEPERIDTRTEEGAKRSQELALSALHAAYKRGWASAEIAAHVGVSPVTVRAWRRGFRTLTPQFHAAILALPDRRIETDKFQGRR